MDGYPWADGDLLYTWSDVGHVFGLSNASRSIRFVSVRFGATALSPGAVQTWRERIAMTDNDADGKRPHKAPRVPLPAGYRQGIISAITVLLGFSLLFLRYWNFEAEGEWTLASLVATILLALAIVLELVALWRSLQPSDDDEAEYQITLRWFLASIVILLASLLLAGLIVSHAINF